METLAELKGYLPGYPWHRVCAYMKRRQKSLLMAPLMVALAALAALDYPVALQAVVTHD
jgi:hypothetical protein